MTISISDGKAASEEDISALESSLGYALSPDFKAFVRANDGAHPENNIFDVGLDNNSDVAEFIPVTKIAYERALIGNLPLASYPIAHDSSGNWIIVNEAERGAIFFHDHEIDGEPIKLADSFNEFVQLLKPFDQDSIELRHEQVKSVWVDPDFLASLKKGR
jgi:hypothetical protein